MKFRPWTFFAAQRNFLLILISSVTLLLVLALDIAFGSPGNMPLHIYWLRELLIVFAFSCTTAG